MYSGGAFHHGYGNDREVGGTGRDLLYGETDNDFLWGGPGNDSLVPGPGHDLAIGGSGDDHFVLRPDRADDVINCGPGRDLVGLYTSRPNNDRLIGCERIVGI